MRSDGGGVVLTVRMNPMPWNAYVEEGEFSMPPPPPPPEAGSSWDYFDPADESFRFLGKNGLDEEIDDVKMYGNFGKKGFDLSGTSEPLSKSDTSANGNHKLAAEKKNNQLRVEGEVNDTTMGEEATLTTAGKALAGKTSSRKKKPNLEFITHRATDFLSSIKDIDNRFFKASESGREVSRMLEANKIHVCFAEARGASSASIYLSSFGSGCCQGGIASVSDDQLVTKVITLKRTTSSKSSSSLRNPLATKDDNDESGINTWQS